MPTIWDRKEEKSVWFSATDNNGIQHQHKIGIKLVDTDYDIVDDLLLANMTLVSTVYDAPADALVCDLKRGHLLDVSKQYEIVVPVVALADYYDLDTWFNYQDYESIEDWHEEDEDGDAAWVYLHENMDDSDVLEALREYYESHKEECTDWKAVGEALDVYADQSGRFAGYVYEDMPMDCDDIQYELSLSDSNAVMATVLVSGRVILSTDLPAINERVKNPYAYYSNESDSAKEEQINWFKQDAKLYIDTYNGTVTWVELLCTLYTFNHDKLKWEESHYEYSGEYTSDYLYDDDNMCKVMNTCINGLMYRYTGVEPILWDDPAFELFKFEMWSDAIDLHFVLKDGEAESIVVNDIVYSLSFAEGRGTVWAYIGIPAGYEKVMGQWVKKSGDKMVRGFDMGETYNPKDHDLIILPLTAREVYRVEAYREQYPLNIEA